jgi:GNAT acetyltransferase-like protein
VNGSNLRTFLESDDDWNRWLDEISGASAYQYHPFAEERKQRFQVFRGDVAVAGGTMVFGRMVGWPRRILAIHRGPVGDLASALDALEAYADAEGVWCIEVMPDAPFDDSLREVFLARHWQPVTSERYTLRLDLTLDEGALMAGLESRGRYSVRRAVREGIAVRPARDHDDIAIFVRLIAEMSAAKKLPRASDDHFLRLAQYLLAHPSRGVVLLAERQNEVLGCNLLWRSALRVEYLYGASRKQKEAVGYPLQWAGIKWAREIGAKEYDLGGYDPNRNGGPALMKRAFCRNVVMLSPRWRKIFRPSLFNAGQRLRGWIGR